MERPRLSGRGNQPSLSRCAQCNKAFLRPEHMKRHALTHEREKPFSCRQCGKCFNRRDVLHRHQQSHQPSGEQAKVSTRACAECASARVRCSKGRPCDRCKTKSLNCSYPSYRQKRTANKIGELSGSEGGLANSATSTDAICRPSHDQATQRFASLNAPSLPGDGDISHSQPVSTEFPLPSSNDSHEPPGPSTGTLAFSSTHGLADDITRMQTLERFVPSIPSQVPGNSHHQWRPPEIQTSYELVSVQPAEKSYLQPGQNGNFSVDDASLLSINWLPVSNVPSPGIDEASFFLHGFIPNGENTSYSDPYDTLQQACASTLAMPHNDFSPPSIASVPQGLYETTMRSDRATRGPQSSPAADSISSSSGKLYVDGEGGRDAKRRISRRRTVQKQTALALGVLGQSSAQSYGFSTTAECSEDLSNTEYADHITSDEYQRILFHFNLLCKNWTFLYESFDDSAFPSVRICNVLFQSYIDNFHPTFPLLHGFAFASNPRDWLVTLAVIATGCMFAQFEGQPRTTDAFQEFLRRSIHFESESGNGGTLLGRAQAQVLNFIGLSQSGNQSLRLKAEKSHASLIGIFQTFGKEAGEALTTMSAGGGGATMTQWIQQELVRRLCFCSWMVWLCSVFRKGTYTVSWTILAEIKLPAHESIWDASESEQWNSSSRKLTQVPSLSRAMEDLYMRSTIDSDLGDLSQTILIYAVYDKTMEIGSQAQQRLNRWTPRTPADVAPPQVLGGWLPDDPIYSDWRNSACDSLDVLHWHANSLAARARGLEPPVTLHLHLARIILLTPFPEVQYAVDHLVGILPTRSGPSLPRLHQAYTVIWRWLAQDQHKSRLVLIHCGAIFWYVRHYGTESFIEPYSIFLAATTLWTYSSYKRGALPSADKITRRDDGDDTMAELSMTGMQSQTGNAALTPPNDSHDGDRNCIDDSDDLEGTIPKFFYLDRPCDDEIAQLFIRKGHIMSANMSRVGPICGSNGPDRILREAAKLLDEQRDTWGIAVHYRDILLRLAELKTSADSR